MHSAVGLYQAINLSLSLSCARCCLFVNQFNPRKGYDIEDKRARIFEEREPPTQTSKCLQTHLDLKIHICWVNKLFSFTHLAFSRSSSAVSSRKLVSGNERAFVMPATLAESSCIVARRWMRRKCEQTNIIMHRHLMSQINKLNECARGALTLIIDIGLNDPLLWEFQRLSSGSNRNVFSS